MEDLCCNEMLTHPPPPPRSLHAAPPAKINSGYLPALIYFAGSTSQEHFSLPAERRQKEEKKKIENITEQLPDGKSPGNSPFDEEGSNL